MTEVIKTDREKTAGREEWAKFLPLIQAFVAGIPIQKKNYRGQWEDVHIIYQIRQGVWRIKPEYPIVQGTWTIEYEFKQMYHPHECAHVDGSGVMTWEGGHDDSPPWPSHNGFTLKKDTEKFTPKETT